jgi:hypothetical protein
MEVGRIDFSPEVLAFAAAMQSELDANNAERGGRSWKHAGIGKLQSFLLDQIAQLNITVFEHRRALSEGSPVPSGKSVVQRAADVANLAMMIADVEGGLTTGN